MNQDTLLLVMAGAVLVSAAALVIQCLAILGVYRKVKDMQEQIGPLIPQAEQVLETTRQAVEDSRRQITEITTRTNDILETTKVQLARVEEIIVDATGKAKVQLDRMEMVVDDTVSRVHETVVMLHEGVQKPVREISGLMAGVRAAFSHFLGGSRPSVAAATQDEEMFI